MRTKTGYWHLPLKKTVIATLLSHALAGTTVLAAGFQINEISPGLQGDATAGAAAANDDVSAMFINPATLATLTDNQLYAGASEILPQIGMSDGRAIHTVNSPGGLFPANVTAPVRGSRSQGNISQSAFVPDFYGSYRINEKLVAGLALVGPYGLVTTYDENSVLRFAAQYSSVTSININPALAYAINDKWSVGAGFQAQYLHANFSNFNGPYTGIDPIDDLIAANRPTTLQGSGWGYGFNAGVFFKPNPTTRLGIGYRSQISENLKGFGQQYTSPGVTVPAPSQNFLFNADTSVRANVKTPQILTVSGAHDMGNWTAKASVQVNFWDSFKQLGIDMPEAFATNSTIQTRWKNTWFGALGAEYHKNTQWTYRAGVAYDQTPTKDKFRDPRIPDSNRVWANLGASYAWSKSVSFDGAYSHIFMQNQTVNVVQASGSSANSTLPLEVNRVHANYKGHADIIALAVRYRY